MTRQDDSEQDDEPRAQTYRIGAVARLTGISVDRLRAWERRYGVVHTRRTPSLGRMYTRDDVDRLLMIKQLVDLGNPISSVAPLTVEQLRERLTLDHDCSKQLGSGAPRPARVVVYGRALCAQIEAADPEPHRLHVVGRFESFAEFERSAPALAPEVLALEYPAVHPETVDEVRDLLARSGAQRAVLVCGFGRQEVFGQLRALGAIILRGPLSLDGLELACRRDATAAGQPAAASAASPSLASALPDAVPPRRFSDTELTRLAGASRSLACECPGHLASLIDTLAAFEAYAAQCRHRHPADAELHAHLHHVSGHARALIEEALEHLAEAEGLPR